ncbi:sugar MFS transporter [Terriglobus roseus]|uniref:MFS transporter, FHS family, L-fucose permease n=1 Tax=Terriglobus roseus TaxID=392734 RepID=A0A1H4JRE3_9BACT|nr:sugar MFS transporter [Terriglobus roseus]SEB48308.1 MFS transporter, FHS family, L-fucose permease [Terriglobus roseus]
MALASTGQEQPAVAAKGGSYALPLALIVALYFGIGFITAMNDVLVPHFKDLFQLTNVRALLVQFAFFGAYFLLSIPSGKIVGRIGYKNGIVAALATIGCGLLLFLPASIVIAYPLFLFALFLVGCGLALLQVAVNPYISALGDPAKAASRLNLAGGFNSVAGTLAPRVGAIFIFVAAGATTAELAQSVRMPYVVLSMLAFALAVLTKVMHLPDLIPQRDPSESGGGSAWDFRHVRFGAFAIFAYVGAEVSIGSLLINYLGQPSMGGLSHAAAAKYVSLYWGGAMVARFIGAWAQRYVAQARALTFVASMGCIFVAAAVFGHGPIALWAIVSCGLFNSVMWPCIFPMSIEGVGKYTSQASGILVTMVVGGAVVPEIQGFLADHYGYQPSFLVVLLCYAYVLFFALYGHRPMRVNGEPILPPAVI